jgi:Phage terminase large subunit (GpA)
MHREDTRTAADADTFARLREALEQQAAKDDAGNRPLANRRSAGFQHDREACGTHMQSPFLPRVPVRRRFAKTASGFSRRPLRSSGLRRLARPSKWAAPGGWPPGSRARAITLPNSQSLGTARSEVRRDLDDLLKTRCEHPLGGSTGIDAAVIDSGFATDSVYRFAFACWRCALTPQPRMNNLHSFDS